MFLMRVVPASFQSIISWMVPVKWRLRRTIKALERCVVPEVERLKVHQAVAPQPTLLSWMIQDARDIKECDPYV